MPGLRRTVVALALLAIVVGAAPRHASAQVVEAEALFQEGRRLLKAGQIAEACDKLEASERIESATGTLFNLADCREKNGQLATAWATFLKAAAASRRSDHDDKRWAEAQRRARALEPRLAYLTISVSAASLVDGLVVSRDGVAIDPALWNQGVPVDAGTYQITAEAPGNEPWSTPITIDNAAQKASVEVPRFKRLEELVAAVEPPPARTPVVEAPVESAHRPTTRRRFTALRKVSLGVAVVGLAGLAGAAGFGLVARDRQQQADRLCPDATCSDPGAVARNDEARSAALRSNLLLGVGGVAVVTAVVLWLIGAPDAIVPVADDDRVGVALVGRF